MKKYALRGHTGADNNCGGGSGGDTTYDTSRCGIPLSRQSRQLPQRGSQPHQSAYGCQLPQGTP